MKNFYKLFGAIIALAAIFAGTQALAAGFAALNTHPSDLATVQVKNVTKVGNSNAGWAPGTQADPGDIVAVQIYYHNSGNAPAQGVRVHIDQVAGGQNVNYQIGGGVTAINANPAFGGASVDLSAPATLTYIPGSATWRPDQMVTGSVPFPNGNGDAVYSASGVSIGTIQQDTFENQFMHQGVVVANFRVGLPPPPAQQCPAVATGNGLATGQTSAQLNGQLVSLGTAQSASLFFEYSTNSSLAGATRTGAQSFAQPGAVNATLSGLTPDTQYFFRLVAESAGCSVPGSVQTFRTQAPPPQPTIVPPQVVTVSGTPLSQTSCLLNGNLTSTGGASSVQVSFDYGLGGDLSQHTGAQTLGGVGTFSAPISGLIADTIYSFRAVAMNSAGTVRDGVLTCRTLAPNVTPPPAGGDTNNTNLNANANANTNNNTNTTTVTVGGQTQTQSQTVNQSNSQSVTVNTTNGGGGYSYQPYQYPNYYPSYNYNPANAFTGYVQPAYVAPVVYTTPQVVAAPVVARSTVAPRAQTISCTRGPSLNSATLTGFTEGDVFGQDLRAWFEWGPTPALGNRSPIQAIVSRTTVNPIDRTILRVPNYGDPYYTGTRNLTYDSIVIPGRPTGSSLGGSNFNAQVNYLENGQTYFYRAVAENGAGTSYGDTLACRLEGGDLFLIPKYVPPQPVYVAPKPTPTFTIPAYVPPTPAPVASVAITKSIVNTSSGASGSGLSARSGDTLEFDIIVRNSGARTLTNVRVSDKLSPYLRFIDANQNGTVTGPLETQVVTWSLGTLGAGEEMKLAVRVQVLLCQVEHEITNAARVTATETSATSNTVRVDIVPGQAAVASLQQGSAFGGVPCVGCGVGQTTQAYGQANVTVAQGPLAFMIVPPQITAAIGDSVVLSLRYQNQSNETLSNVALRSFLPINTEFISADNGQGQMVNFDRTTAFTVGTVAPGQSGELRLTMRIAQGAHAGDSLVLTGLASYNRGSGERVDADTSATITVAGTPAGATNGNALTNLNKTGVGPGLLGSAFFPNTLFGWLGLILLIIVIIFVVRKSL